LKISELVRKVSKRNITSNEQLINDGRRNKEIVLRQRKFWDPGRMQTTKMHNKTIMQVDNNNIEFGIQEEEKKE
jgi:hypothetical protein